MIGNKQCETYLAASSWCYHTLAVLMVIEWYRYSNVC